MCTRKRLDRVLRVVARKHDLQPVDLLSKARFAHIVQARNEAVAVMVDRYKTPFAEIARLMGVHHATIIRAYGAHHKAKGVDSKYSRIYERRLERYHNGKHERPAES